MTWFVIKVFFNRDLSLALSDMDMEEIRYIGIESTKYDKLEEVDKVSKLNNFYKCIIKNAKLAEVSSDQSYSIYINLFNCSVYL